MRCSCPVSRRPSPVARGSFDRGVGEEVGEEGGRLADRVLVWLLPIRVGPSEGLDIGVHWIWIGVLWTRERVGVEGSG